MFFYTYELDSQMTYLSEEPRGEATQLLKDAVVFTTYLGVPVAFKSQMPFALPFQKYILIILHSHLLTYGKGIFLLWEL